MSVPSLTLIRTTAVASSWARLGRIIVFLTITHWWYVVAAAAQQRCYSTAATMLCHSTAEGWGLGAGASDIGRSGPGGMGVVGWGAGGKTTLRLWRAHAFFSVCTVPLECPTTSCCREHPRAHFAYGRYQYSHQFWCTRRSSCSSSSSRSSSSSSGSSGSGSISSSSSSSSSSSRRGGGSSSSSSRSSSSSSSSGRPPPNDTYSEPS